ncbi:hypothetical protein Tco_0058036 [Tanacetum coccineum]
MIASAIAFGCGDVILNLLRGGNITNDGNGGTDDSNDGGDVDDGDGGGDDGGGGGDDGDSDGAGDGDMPLLRGDAAISSVIAASMDGKRENGDRTIFLGTDPPLRGLPLTPMGHAQMSRTQCPIPVRLVPQVAQYRHPRPMRSRVMVEPQMAWSQH